MPENGNRLIVTNNEIKARGGVLSDRTISKARKELIEKGFLDVTTPSAFPLSGVYGLSNRYKQFPLGSYKPKEDALPVSFVRVLTSLSQGMQPI